MNEMLCNKKTNDKRQNFIRYIGETDHGKCHSAHHNESIDTSFSSKSDV